MQSQSQGGCKCTHKIFSTLSTKVIQGLSHGEYKCADWIFLKSDWTKVMQVQPHKEDKGSDKIFSNSDNTKEL
jgi:hypothetical protein